jgi:hypothetical protein
MARYTEQANEVRRCAFHNQPMPTDLGVPEKVRRSLELMYLEHSKRDAKAVAKSLPALLESDPVQACRTAMMLVRKCHWNTDAYVAFVRGMTQSQQLIALKQLRRTRTWFKNPLADALYSQLDNLPVTSLHLASRGVIDRYKHLLYRPKMPQGLRWRRIIDRHYTLFEEYAFRHNGARELCCKHMAGVLFDRIVGAFPNREEGKRTLLDYIRLLHLQGLSVLNQ